MKKEPFQFFGIAKLILLSWFSLYQRCRVFSFPPICYRRMRLCLTSPTLLSWAWPQSMRLGLAAGTLVGAVLIAAPALADVLVGNIGQTSASDSTLTSAYRRAATSFTTGSKTGGYTLGIVELPLSDITAERRFPHPNDSRRLFR